MRLTILLAVLALNTPLSVAKTVIIADAYIDVAMRDAIAAGEFIGPRMLVSGPSFPTICLPLH